MFDELAHQLLPLYLFLIGTAAVGWLLGRLLPPSAPVRLGQFLFWIGVPIGILSFLRRADLSGGIWLAPAVAWAAIGSGLLLARTWLKSRQQWHSSARGSFMLSSMVGNTGYLGYPVALALVGESYFAWALFYDMFGTVFGSYGLGSVLASRYGGDDRPKVSPLKTLTRNPTLWAVPVGVLFRQVPLPEFGERLLQGWAWMAVTLSLLLIGMRLGQLSSWHNFGRSLPAVGIKMVLVPLVWGSILAGLGLHGAPLLVMQLQSAMPPAFGTLILAETYNLDRDLTASALAIGSIGLLLTLPFWLWWHHTILQ